MKEATMGSKEGKGLTGQQIPSSRPVSYLCTEIGRKIARERQLWFGAVIGTPMRW